ncbi:MULTISPECIES: 4'-phosphopantetheinyl transferase superfamily protein [unclassified Kitasatospora]|uniref:4'-phosphopantetheinyl transferase family protein n=1 Tax=unclassified Kitasatospora TaxID=2633591 RepID=UPI0007C6AF17|nr:MULTISPECIES: 4'-phosphopantetheinyl transferase superfamily protein [unclassified Kitasatospora]
MTPLVMMAGSAEVLARPDLGEHLLTDLERTRADRFRLASSRADFVAAHLLVRECAARLMGRPVAGLTLLQRCPDCARDDHGKPYLAEHPEAQVSLSHGRGVVAAAAGLHPVGVDVEQSSGGTAAEVMERVLSAGELRRVREHADPDRAFLRLWVRKEAMVKLGRTTLDTLTEIDLSALELDGSPLRSRYGDLHLLDWVDERHGAAVGVVSTEEPRVEQL